MRGRKKGKEGREGKRKEGKKEGGGGEGGRRRGGREGGKPKKKLGVVVCAYNPIT
jgi:hypothetical protein